MAYIGNSSKTLLISEGFRYDMNKKKPSVWLIDVLLSEIELPNLPDNFPDFGVDVGVVPWAMVEYLKRTERFPVAPTLTFTGGLFRPIQGGRCLWAGRQAQWSKPIQCILSGTESTVMTLSNRIRPFSQQSAISRDDELRVQLLTQVLCFARELTTIEQGIVDNELRKLAGKMNTRSLPIMNDIQDLVWSNDTVVSWKTPITLNPEDRSITDEFDLLLATIFELEIPLVAHNGRRCWKMKSQNRE